MAGKSFKFATANNIEMFFASAADGSNVVKIFREAVSTKCNQFLPSLCRQDVINSFLKFVVKILREAVSTKCNQFLLSL